MLLLLGLPGFLRAGLAFTFSRGWGGGFSQTKERHQPLLRHGAISRHPAGRKPREVVLGRGWGHKRILGVQR